MTWKQAVEHMRQGGKVTRKHWLINDYLYLKEGVLFCDGNFEYLEYLKSTAGIWLKYKERGLK